MKIPFIQLIQRLDKFASSFSSITGLEQMVQLVEEILEDTFQVEYTALYLFNPEENRLKLLYAKGFTKEEIVTAEKTAIDRHPGKVFRTKKMIYIPDTQLDVNNTTKSSQRSFVVRSRLYLPVMNGDQVVGAFGLVDSKPSAYTEEDIASLSFICNMAGALYGNILNQNLLRTANNEILDLSKLPSESPNPILRISNDRILLYANPASDKLLEFFNLKLGDDVYLDLPNGSSLFADLVQNEKSIEQEILCGEKIYSFVLTPVKGMGYINLYGRDITNRRELENELKKMALIARETGNAVIITDKKGRIEWVNDAFTQMTEFRLEEIKGMIPGKFLQGVETNLQTVALLSNAIQNQLEVEVDIINYTKSGKKYWVKIQLQPVFNSAGEIENFISIQKEITKEKEIEHELIKTTTFQKAILNSADIAIISTDLKGIIQSFNPAACKMLGYEADEIVGKMTPILFHDESEVRSTMSKKAEFKACYFGICENNQEADGYQLHSEKNEYTFIRKDGNRLQVSLTTSTLRSEEGEVSGFLGMAEDITSRKEQYDDLQLANLKFRSLISSMQAGVMVEDEHRRVVLVNQYFCNLFSIPYSPEQLIGADCVAAAEASKELFKDPDMFIRDIEHTLALGQPVTNFELQFKSGVSVERDFIPIEDAERKNHGILWIYRDITNRKNNERDLQRQSQILSGTAQAMNYLLTLTDHGESIKKALETIGIATKLDRVYIFENAEDEVSGDSFFSQRYEWVAEGITPQIDNPELQNMPYSTSFPRWYSLLASGKTVSGLTKDFPDFERKILESEDILSIIVAPIFVRDHLWGMVGFDDCTIGINWSLNEISILTALAGSIGGSISRSLMEKELITARQLAEYATKSKSDFLATMSHEIRTPMNGVIGMTSLLMQTQLTSDQRDYAETIKVSGELLLGVINDILDFSKVESGKLVLEEYQFDLRMAIEDVIDLMAVSALEKNLGLYYHIDPSIPEKVTADLTRLRQILVNLTGNALKFTKEGEVVIRVKQIEQIGSEAILEFSVQDTGVGIPKEKIDMLFKPFSQVDASTTRKFGGTGLGLAICAKFVELMHGAIWVKSEENRGSQFLFTIKTTYEPNQPTEDKSTLKNESIREKRILIVDANPVSRYILCSIFDNIRLKPYCTDSVSEAVTLLENSKDIDLVLLEHDFQEKDTEIKDMNILKLKNIRNIPFILITNPSLPEQLLAIQKHFPHRISKPIKHSQLIAYVTSILSDQKSDKMPMVNPPKQYQKINDLFPLNILVAEDNAINQKLITLLFQMLGYQIHIAANGYEVLEALNRLKIDIVFMDIQMPEMDGFEATKQIIATWGSHRPLIIAMTANALRSDEEQCLAAGMDDYISKPLTIGQVKEGIEKWALLCNKL